MQYKVTGHYASNRVYKSLTAARRVRDRLDCRYGAYVHRIERITDDCEHTWTSHVDGAGNEVDWCRKCNEVC